MNAPRPVWSTQTKVIVIVVLLAIFALILNKIRPILAPLVLAVILAYVLSPLVAVIHRTLRVSRGIAILFTYLLLVLVLVLLGMLVIPMIARQSSDVFLDLQTISKEIIKDLGQQWTIGGISVDGKGLLDRLSGSLQPLIQPLFGSTLGILVNVFSSLAYVVFLFVVSIYLIKDSAKLRVWMEHLVPAIYRPDYIRLREEINMIWSSFFRGQLILAAVVALIISTVGFIVGLPFALAMGALAGILEFLPSLGHGIWMVSASLLGLIFGSTWLPLPNWAFALLIVLLHTLFIQFDLNYLIPRIIGRSVHLPPLVVIVGIVSGAILAGVLGLMLAAPTIASLRVLGRYIYFRILDEDPFGDSISTPLPPPDPYWWRHSTRKVQKSVEEGD